MSIAAARPASRHVARAEARHDRERALVAAARHQHRRGGEWIECRLLTSGERTNPWFQECSDRVIQTGDIVAFDTDLIGPTAIAPTSAAPGSPATRGRPTSSAAVRRRARQPPPQSGAGESGCRLPRIHREELSAAGGVRGAALFLHDARRRARRRISVRGLSAGLDAGASTACSKPA